jgi:hypothetical protein
MEITQSKLTFLELAKKIIEEEKKPLSSVEIWEMAKIKSYDKYVGSQGKTPWATIGAQIYVNIRDNKKSPFIKIDSSPTRFYLRTLIKKGEELKFIEEQPITVLKQKRFEYLDWDAINKLASINPVFEKFLKRVKNDISSNEIIKEYYDKIYSEEELIKFVQK